MSRRGRRGHFGHFKDEQPKIPTGKALNSRLDENFRITIEREIREFNEDHNILGKKIQF